MRDSIVPSLFVFVILALGPGLAWGHGHCGGGHGGFGHGGGGHRGGVGLGYVLSPFPGPAFGPGGLSSNYSRSNGFSGWSLFGRPGLWNGLVSSPGGRGGLAIGPKPDEATVLQGESRMEEQVRAVEQAPSEEGGGPSNSQESDPSPGDWQPL